MEAVYVHAAKLRKALSEIARQGRLKERGDHAESLQIIGCAKAELAEELMEYLGMESE